MKRINNSVRIGKAVIHVRSDKRTVTAKIPKFIPVQYEFEMDAVPVDILVNNLSAKSASFVDAIDAQHSLHAIRRLYTNHSQRSSVDTEPRVFADCSDQRKANR